LAPSREDKAPSHKRRAPAPAKAAPTRTSRRLRGLNTQGQGQASTPEAEAEEQEASDTPEPALVSFEAHFPPDVQALAIPTTGHYTGWVAAAVQARYALEGNAADAWERNGGGTFSFRSPGRW
jgi:hypothetical protein